MIVAAEPQDIIVLRGANEAMLALIPIIVSVVNVHIAVKQLDWRSIPVRRLTIVSQTEDQVLAVIVVAQRIDDQCLQISPIEARIVAGAEAAKIEEMIELAGIDDIGVL